MTIENAIKDKKDQIERIEARIQRNLDAIKDKDEKKKYKKESKKYLDIATEDLARLEEMKVKKMQTKEKDKKSRKRGGD